MPKKSIALVLLITLTLGPVSGVFGSIMDKINSYNYLAVRNFYNKALWFSSDSNAIEAYALSIQNSPANPMGQNAVFAFGMIGADNVTHPITINNEPQDLALVASPPEYYFTDMAFIQQKYEAALVDLYYFRAECSTFEDRTKRSPAPTGSHSRTASATPRRR